MDNLQQQLARVEALRQAEAEASAARWAQQRRQGLLLRQRARLPALRMPGSTEDDHHGPRGKITNR